jgi:glycosyltransferase involved in cell wall biosynthesis
VGGASDAEEERYLDELRGLACRLLANVEFMGHRTDAMQLIANAHVFVMTALNEGFGRVLVEAMHVGTPIVAVDSGSVAEVVGDAGILVEPRDVVALKRSVAHVLQDRDLAERLRQRALRRARALFDPKKAASRLMAVFEEALSFGIS